MNIIFDLSTTIQQFKTLSIASKRVITDNQFVLNYSDREYF